MAPEWPHVESPTGVVHIIACGSRKWTLCTSIGHHLEALRQQHPILTVVEGGNPEGADACAGSWAARSRSKGVHWVHVPARWNDYPLYDKWRAGHDRNQVMLDMLLSARDGHGHGVAVVAFKQEFDPAFFVNPAKSKGGTEDMIRRAWEAEVPVWHSSSEHVPHLLAPQKLF